MKKKFTLTNQEIESRLRQAGLQPTLQRISICKYVLCEADHPTAEQVFAWAEQNMSKISLATVYNTLHSLVEAGLIREFKFAHSEKAVYDNNIEEHFHFLDLETQKLLDVDPASIQVQLSHSLPFEISKTDILFQGYFKQSSN
jgi:Fur family iron response transcriptional regulator